MKKRLIIPGLLLIILFFACSKDDDILSPQDSTDYSLKVYALERSPKINRTGAGMDFIHDATVPDTTYFGSDTHEDFNADAIFYNLMVYYTDNNGDVQSEGCPAILLASAVTAVKIGTGITEFESYDTITQDVLNSLCSDTPVDFEACKNTDGMYEKELVLEAYKNCVIGNKFRGRLIVIPEGGQEQDVQPVYLIKTIEGLYVKFMVKQFKGNGADKQKTIVQWQAISS